MNNIKNTYDINNIELKNVLLGIGGFAKVYLGKIKSTNENVAIKIINLSDLKKEDWKFFINEINNHIKLKHENIIELYGYYLKDNKLHLVLEFAEKGNLFNYIYKYRKDTICEKEIKNILIQIIKSLEYIHSFNIIHRDIKPENILITKDFKFKLSDFGLSNIISSYQKRITFCGTIEYMAPEIIEKENQTLKTDIWALGVLLFEMLNKRSLFKKKNFDEIIRMSEEQNFPFNPNISEEAKNLIKSLLIHNQKDRISLHNLKNHPFLKEKSVQVKVSHIFKSKNNSINKNNSNSKQINSIKNSINNRSILKNSKVHSIKKVLPTKTIRTVLKYKSASIDNKKLNDGLKYKVKQNIHKTFSFQEIKL